MSKINYILGYGERLTEPVKVKPGFGEKTHPYRVEEARNHLLPQFESISMEISHLPENACPLGYGVMRWALHPQYISKSAFPSGLIRSLGLESVGSRTTEILPRKWTRKENPKNTPTTELFIAGTQSHLQAIPNALRSLSPDSPEASQLIGLERVSVYDPTERIQLVTDPSEKYLEVGIHLLRHEDTNEIKGAFLSYAKDMGFEPREDLAFTVSQLWFIPMKNLKGKLSELAKFTLIRVIRPVPKLRGLRPFHRAAEVSASCKLPEAPPISTDVKVAILDGGLPEKHAAIPWVRRYRKLDESAADDPDGLDHGLAVTSAFLFGPLSGKTVAKTPFTTVDHFRVLDGSVSQEDPYELYRTLGMVEEVLLSRQYSFLNLSLGPDLPIEDTDIHPWTAVIDDLLSDGETLMTIAVGNNGERDRLSGNARVQVPSDSVNALSVGAADTPEKDWLRAEYSAIGPGRCPGIVKPDLMAFGGGPEQYFHVLKEGSSAHMVPTMGTSFAAPYLLRTAVGVRTLLGDEIKPLAIKSLLVHTAERTEHDPIEVGWGKIPEDVMELVSCPEGVARVVYQGELNPGKYIRAKIPIPKNGLKGRIRLKATFCYACPTDPQDMAAYTRAGLDVIFRPNVKKIKKGKEHPSTKSFFTRKPYATEAELRADHGKWETVMHGECGMLGSSLNQPTFDIHYNARETGAITGSAKNIPYALVITIEAQRHTELYNEILQTYQQILSPIQPKIDIDINI